MAGVPARDQLGRGIAQKATMSLKRKAAARAGTPLAASLLTGKRRAPGTPLPLSSAGKRLASNLRGATPASDVQLRASYKSTPQGMPCLLITAMLIWFSCLLAVIMFKDPVVPVLDTRHAGTLHNLYMHTPCLLMARKTAQQARKQVVFGVPIAVVTLKASILKL